MSGGESGDEKKGLPFAQGSRRKMFGKAAMDRLTDRDEFREIFRPTGSRSWIRLLAGALVLAAAAIWVVWGRG